MSFEGDHLLLLDQRYLPHQSNWLKLSTVDQVVESIKTMAVRGAPAIGIAGAYGMVLAVRQGMDRTVAENLLIESRPTAVNLKNNLERLSKVPFEEQAMLDEARKIEAEDLAMNLNIGRLGADLVPQGAGVLTICNTGSLATAGHGTALGIIRSAHEMGKDIYVYSCETRPRQQGLRLTAWELLEEKIPFKSIPDSAAASLMASGRVQIVLAGADRIAQNGDTANKIGTLMLAVLAKHYNVPFVIAAPSSTFDPKLPNGSLIPIEERDSTELTHIEGVAVAPEGTPVWNPGFDVTPGELITAIVSETRVHAAPYHFEEGSL